MSRAFAYCVQRVLSEEGGLADHPQDPGGRTALGITQGTLAAARKVVPGLPARVDDLTREQAMAIYEALYWRPVHGDALPLGVALLIFDAAVNQGVAAAAKFLQRGLGVAADGKIGPATLAAAQARGTKALPEIAARRMNHYMGLHSLTDTFGLGWSRRLMRVFAEALRAPEDL